MFLKIKQINYMLVQEFMRQYLWCKRLPKKQNQQLQMVNYRKSNKNIISKNCMLTTSAFSN